MDSTSKEPDRKVKLTLNVLGSFIQKAKKLARKRRRSVSALFEDLIEEEQRRKKKKESKPINDIVRDGQKPAVRLPWMHMIQLGAAIACSLSLAVRANLHYGKGIPDGRSAYDPTNHIYRHV